MKRIATISTVLAVLTLGLAIPAQAAPVAVWTNPSFGEAGSAIDVNVAVFTPGSTFEVHAGSFDGPLLGSGTTDSAGEGSVGITIPWSAPEGFYTLAVCETSFVACTDTWSDFWLGATVTFTVIPPPPTTTGIPEVRLEPDRGEEGSTTTVLISGFTPDSTFEIHLLGWDLLGSGASNGIGEGAVVVRISDDIEAGEWTIGVCETEFVACDDVTSDFWVGATAAFTVVAPPPPPPPPPPAPTTTDTTAPPTPPIAAPATTTTTAAPATTTTTVAEAAPVITSATPGVGTDNDVVALPILQEPVGDSGSDLWWLLLIVLGAALIGALLAWTLQEEE